MNDLATGAAAVLQGTIQLDKVRIEYRTSFSSGLRFRCLPDCGLCCRTYRIALTEPDLDRLKRVVEPEACSTITFSSREKGGIAAFMENGKAEGCCYLDERLRCSVYGNRPLYCRTYPLIRDTYEQLEMSVDHTCPGIGEGDALAGEQIEEAFLMEAQSRPELLDVAGSSANYRLICASLGAMGVYTDAGLMRSVCSRLIGRGLTFRHSSQISAFLTGAAAALAKLPTGNIMDPEAALRMAEGVEEVPGGGSEGPEGNELSDGAAESLADYLQEWIRRQALLRFVHATTLASPRRENVLHSFFLFLTHAASEILSDARKLRRREAQRRITARLMRDAIRKNEGALRSRCASVVSTS